MAINVWVQNVFETKAGLTDHGVTTGVIQIHMVTGGLSKIHNFNQINFLRPLAPLQGEIDIWTLRLFCMKFDSEQLSFGAFLDVMLIFGSVEP